MLNVVPFPQIKPHPPFKGEEPLSNNLKPFKFSGARVLSFGKDLGEVLYCITNA